MVTQVFIRCTSGCIIRWYNHLPKVQAFFGCNNGMHMLYFSISG